MNDFDLINKAVEAMAKSYSPYSNFKVGAALMSENGDVYLGSNIENISFSATNCAERTAFFSAIENGERDFAKIAVVGGKNGEITDYCYPCGVCLQVMSEFCNSDFELILYDGKNINKKYLNEMLPNSFKMEDNQ